MGHGPENSPGPIKLDLSGQFPPNKKSLEEGKRENERERKVLSAL